MRAANPFRRFEQAFYPTSAYTCSLPDAANDAAGDEANDKTIGVFSVTRSMDDSKPNPFMARAIALAVENVPSGKGGPFGCVIVREGTVIAEGVNQVTTANDPTAHAEVTAIRSACQRLKTFDLRGCELYTSCEPCPMCLSAIYWARIDKVYFGSRAEDAARAGFDDSTIYEEIALPPARRKIQMLPLMREQSLAAFQAWAEQPGKIVY